MIVRLALIVGVGQVAQEFRHRRPDGVDANGVPPVERRDAVGLWRREMQAVLLAENLRHRIRDASRTVHQLDELLGELLSLRPAAAVELHRERLPFSRRPDVEAQHRGERHRRPEGAERRNCRPETLIDLVPIPLRRGIEAAHIQQRLIGRRLLTPAVQLALSVQQQVGCA